MHAMRPQTNQPASNSIKKGILSLANHDARRDERHHPTRRTQART